MRQIAFFAAASLIGFASALPAADQQMMNLLMPNAKIVAGVNVQQARNSQFGQFVLSHMGSDQDLQKFIETSGFDPRQDLQEILIATDLQDGTHSGLIVARGKFDAAKIADLAAKTGGQKVTTYKGVQIFGGPGNESGSALAILDNSLAIAGNLSTVKAAIDRKTAVSSINPALATRVNELSTTQDAWTVSIAPLSDLSKMPMPDPTLQGALQGDLLKTVQQTSGGIKFGSTVQITGQALAKSDKDATSLGDVVKFLAGMIQVNSKDEPVKTLVQNLDVKTDGSTLKVSLSIAEDQLESFVRSQKPVANKSKATAL